MKSKDYDEFVEKFKPKKTTDDCYTPPSIYAVVRDWACKEYGIDPDKIVRPFYPSEDYERFNYPEGAVVLDNPPFSILAKICTFYLGRGIPFFLFAPSLTCFSGQAIFMQMNHLVCDANIVYENGAVVKTSFVTSYGIDFKIRRGECVQIGCLDAQKPEKKKIFGSGLLLSDRLAKERAAAEKAAAVVWSLSEREKEIASQLK